MIKKDNIVIASDMATFVNNIKDFVSGKINFTYNNPPKFAGSTTYNVSYYDGTQYTNQSNPNAIPITDLTTNTISSLSISKPVKGTQLSGQEVFNVLLNIVNQMTYVKKFTSQWHNRYNGSDVLVNSVSGTACFKGALPGVTGYSETLSSNCAGWTRDTSTATDNISVSNPFTVGSTVNADVANAFLTKLQDEWTKIYDSKSINYNFYTCHYNCHDNCHSSGRHRR